MPRKGVFYPKGKERSIKSINALISLLFLVAIAAMSSALPLDSGSSNCAVTEANPPLMGEWVKKADTPATGGYGEAIVGTGKNIYIARCFYATSVPTFWHYNPKTDNWDSMSISCLPTGAFRNGAALAWDREDSIYTLLGARYKAGDDDRCLFYRYSITNNSWEQLADTPHAQGAGDAIAWSGYDGYIYAIIGNKDRKSVFTCYNISNNSWNELLFNHNWTSTDDGASLVWTGGEYLYALQGEWQETVPNQDFARFHIPTQSWVDLSPIPESEGVGDGASLLWIGNWLSEYNDYIFALGGGSCLEDPGYNFYRYSISQNEWNELESIPCPVGNYVGNRLGFADGRIYYWQGAPSTWDCGGDAFYMFNLPPTPTVSISTDKKEFHPGDIMNISIHIENPTETTQQVTFGWYLILPDSGYWQKIMFTEITLTPGFNESFSMPLRIKYWVPIEFNATWHVVLLDKTTYEIISEDDSDWKYTPRRMVYAITMPTEEEIAEEIMKTAEIEKVVVVLSI